MYSSNSHVSVSSYCGNQSSNPGIAGADGYGTGYISAISTFLLSSEISNFTVSIVEVDGESGL